VAANPEPGPLNDPPGLNIVIRQEGAATAIELHGEWDLAGLPSIRQAMTSAPDNVPETLVLDLSRLEFIDSSGVHATTELAERAAAQHTRLLIIPGSGPAQRIFEITGLLDRLPFIDKWPTGPRVAGPHTAAFPPRAHERPGRASTG
jgi:anti-sigma B factor antagonist